MVFITDIGVKQRCCVLLYSYGLTLPKFDNLLNAVDLIFSIPAKQDLAQNEEPLHVLLKKILLGSNRQAP